MIRKTISIILSAAIHILLLCVFSFQAAPGNPGAETAYIRVTLAAVGEGSGESGTEQGNGAPAAVQEGDGSAAWQESGETVVEQESAEPFAEEAISDSDMTANEETAVGSNAESEAAVSELTEEAPLPEPEIETENFEPINDPLPEIVEPPKTPETEPQRKPKPEKKPEAKKPAQTKKPVKKENAPKPDTPKNAPSSYADAAISQSQGPSLAQSSNGSNGSGGADSAKSGNNGATGKTGSANTPLKPAIVDIATLKATKKMNPDYPMISRKRRDQGTVILLVTISSDTVKSVSIEQSSGFPPLDEAAIRAVKQWKFEMSGFEDEITARIPFKFELK